MRLQVERVLGSEKRGVGMGSWRAGGATTVLSGQRSIVLCWAGELGPDLCFKNIILAS